MGGSSPCNPKSLNFPLLLDITFHQKVSPFFPPLITDHILGKKVFLKAFRQILPNILPGMRIFSYTISLLTKNIPSFDVALLPRPGLDCPPFPEPMWETLMHSICILPYQKCNSFPIKWHFPCNDLVQASFVAVTIVVVSFLF